MKADVLEVDDGGTALVRVVDGAGNDHVVGLDAAGDGSVLSHRQDAFPHSPEARTDLQETVMRQVHVRARFAVHTTTEYDVLSAGWDPRDLAAAAEAVGEMSTDEFEEAFGDFRRALTDPEGALADPEEVGQERGVTAGTGEDPGDPTVVLVAKDLCLDDGDRGLREVPPGVCVYYTTDDGGEVRGAGTSVDCPGGTTRVASLLRPPEVDDDGSPAALRATVVNDLLSQGRDVYLCMGEYPPPPFDIDGPGKPLDVFLPDRPGPAAGADGTAE